MKKNLLTLTLAIAVTLGIATTTVSAATIDVNSGESIQAAINSANPGDIINVGPGTYAGPVNINKSLTLRGAQAGVDARDRTGGETVITSAYAGGFSVQSADVTIDGFTIDGATAGAIGRGIVLPVATDASNLTVKNNIIQNNQIGVATALSSDPAIDGAVISDLVISNNKFADNNQTGTAASIFVANASGSGIEIVDNDFANTDDGQPAPANTNAISINGVVGAPISDIVVRGNSSVNDGSFIYVYNTTNVTIDNNTSDNQAGNGVLIGSSVANVTVSNNTLTDSNNGVRLSGAVPANNVTVTGNTISGMTTAGVSVADGAVSDPVVLTDNTITGNALGVMNESALAINANFNWWGCEAGPGSTDCDATQGVVLASEWYTSDAMTVTNLDADESVVPGVPNTSQAASTYGYLAAALVAVAAIVAAVLVAYRRRSTNS